MEQSAVGPDSAPRPAGPSLIGLIRILLDDIRGLISDRVHLAALELRQARRALAQVVGMLFFAAILAATAWIALWGFLIACAVVVDLAWWAIWLAALLVNGVGSWLAIRRARGLLEFLALPATLRRLTIAPSSSPAESVPADHPHPPAGQREGCP